jgi:hypothetical protein
MRIILIIRIQEGERGGCPQKRRDAINRVSTTKLRRNAQKED